MPTATAMAMGMALPPSVYADLTSIAVATPVPTSVHDLEVLAATEALAHRVAAVFRLPAG
jgi:hypothetical protein